MNITPKLLMGFIGKSFEVLSAITEEISIHENRMYRYGLLQIFILSQAIEEIDKDVHLKRVTKLTGSKPQYIRRIRGNLIAHNLLILDLDHNTVVVPQEIKELMIKIAEEKLLHTSKRDIVEDTYGSVDVKLIEKHEGIEYKGDVGKAFGG